jgi:hypothetical protein
MAADLATALALLLTGPHEALTALWVAAFLAGSLVIAKGLRRLDLEGAAFGLLVLAAAADLALFTLRASAAPIFWHLPLTFILAVALTWVLRRWILAPTVPRRPLTRADLMLMVLVGVGFWALRMVQVDPSSGLSSLLGWVPTYMRDCFAAERFLLPDDFRLGTGPAGGLIFSVDMLGLVALAGDLGAGQFYPPYLATSVLGVGLAVLLPLASFRGRPLAQLTYVGLLAALLVVDFQVQAAVGRHWGDTILILGGSLILLRLTRRPFTSDSLLSAACAACFLVLARHYGALLAALLMLGLAAVAWQRRGSRVFVKFWPAGLALGVLLGLLSLREINYILHPTTFYPAGRLLEIAAGGWDYHLMGALHDWGFLTDERWNPVVPRTAWLFGLLALLVADRGRCLRRPSRLVILLAPFTVMLLPLAQEALTGYRTALAANKPYLLAILFGAVYPAFAVAWLTRRERLQVMGDKVLHLALIGVAAASLLWLVGGPLVGMGPGRALAWARDTYDKRIVDRGIAQVLAAEGIPVAAVADHPMMYFYCEPGMGLRNYIGGSLRRDLDFWGATVQDSMLAAKDMAALLAGLGWPNLYFSSPASYAKFFPDSPWRTYRDELDAVEHQPWVERVVRFGNARFVIVKKP